MTRFQEMYRADLVFLEKQGVGLRALFDVPFKTSEDRELHHRPMTARKSTGGGLPRPSRPPKMTARKSTSQLSHCCLRKRKNIVASNLAICFSVRSGRRRKKSIQVSYFGDALYPWPYNQDPVIFKIRATFQAKDDPSCKFEVVSEDVINPDLHFPDSVGFNEVALEHEVDIWEGRRFTCTVTLVKEVWNASQDPSLVPHKLLTSYRTDKAHRFSGKLEMSERKACFFLNCIYSFNLDDALASSNANAAIHLLEADYNDDIPCTIQKYMIQLIMCKAEAMDFRELEESESEHESDSELDVDDYVTKEDNLKHKTRKRLGYTKFYDEDSGSDDENEGAVTTENTSKRLEMILDDKSTRAVGGVREWLSIGSKIRAYIWSFENGCKELMEKMMELLKRSRSKLNKSRMFKELVTRGDPNFLKELGYRKEQKKGPNKEEAGQEGDVQSSSTSSDEEQHEDESLEEETNQLIGRNELQIFLESLDRNGFEDVREKVVKLLKTERSKSKESNLFEELMGRTDYERNFSQMPRNPTVSGKEGDKDDMLERSKFTQTPTAAPLNNSIETTEEGSGNEVNLDDPIIKIEVDEESVDDDSRLMQDELPVNNGDSLFEEEDHMLKYEIESEAEEERSTTQSLNVNIDDPVISRSVPTPGNFRQREGTLLVDKIVDIYWKTGGAYLECSLCNYELRFSTYSEKGMAEGFKSMELHVRENHKDQATEMGLRFGERPPYQCSNLGCETLFANQESRDKHEVTHRTCDVCGKQVGEKGMSEKRKKAAMVTHMRSHEDESKRASNQREQKASSSKKRKIDQR